MTYRFTSIEDGRPTRKYATAQCGTCPIRTRCTRSLRDGRRISRWEDEHVLDVMAERVRDNPQVMKQRKQIVEHPFGTMKRSMNQGYFLMRGLPKVRAEMSLTVLAYNLKRVLNILGVERLLAVVIQRRDDTCLIMIRVRINIFWRRARYCSLVLMDFSHGLALELTAFSVGERGQFSCFLRYHCLCWCQWRQLSSGVSRDLLSYTSL